MPLWEYYAPDSRKWLPMTDSNGDPAGNMSAEEAEELKFTDYDDDTTIRVRAHSRKGTRGVRAYQRAPSRRTYRTRANADKRAKALRAKGWTVTISPPWTASNPSRRWEVTPEFEG